jgi:PAT family beta-lactamase induction signal transducer AmpG
MATEAATDGESPGWRYYLQEKLVVLFFLGFSAGLPFALVYSTLTAWLFEAGLEKSTISTFAWVGFAYAFKFLWSPLVDRLTLPVLTAVFGRRRAWMLLSQVAIAYSLIVLSGMDPAGATGAFALVAIAVAVSSATQDMAIDAYRIECADRAMLAPLAAAYQYGYRVSLIISGAGALFIAQYGSWELAYLCMAVCMVVGLITTLLCREPDVPESAQVGPIFEGGVIAWFVDSVVGPFVDFFRRYGSFALTMLAFIALYRISDYVLGILANPFYLDIGFTKAEIASVAKIYGFWLSLAGIAGGGWSVIRFGLGRSLIAAATLIGTTNLFFAGLAYAGPDLLILAVTISFDNFAQGFGGTVFIAYLSSLTNISFTATQYALFSSLSVFFGKLIAGYSGEVQEMLGYVGFFIYAAAMGIPAIILSIIVVRRGEVSENLGRDG